MFGGPQPGLESREVFAVEEKVGRLRLEGSEAEHGEDDGQANARGVAVTVAVTVAGIVTVTAGGRVPHGASLGRGCFSDRCRRRISPGFKTRL